MTRCSICAMLAAAAALAWPQTPGRAAVDPSPDAAAPPAASPDHQGEVQIETGLVLPLGDLAAGYAHTQRGMGAERGYLLGLRLRFYPERRLVLAPSFAYVEFGDHDTVDADGDRLRIQTSQLRYGLDLCYLAPAAAGPVRPFVGAGVAVARNRYREEIPDGGTLFRADVNAIVGSLVAGVRMGDWECSLQYDLNRFTSSRLSYAGDPLPYRWHSAQVRVGYMLPRF